VENYKDAAWYLGTSKLSYLSFTLRSRICMSPITLYVRCIVGGTLKV